MTHPQWAEKLTEHIAWLGNQQDVKSAVIKLQPEQLGPLEINISVTKDEATVNISSHSGLVRDMIDQAIPRLRDMMMDQGVNLVQVNINAESNQRQFGQQGQNGQEVSAEYEEDQQVDITPLTKKPPKGLIDYFA